MAVDPEFTALLERLKVARVASVKAAREHVLVMNERDELARHLIHKALTDAPKGERLFVPPERDISITDCRCGTDSNPVGLCCYDTSNVKFLDDCLFCGEPI